MSLNIGILDYGGGNLRSVSNAFKAIDHAAEFINSAKQIDSLDLLVLPGQGAFGDAVRQLQITGLWQPVKKWLAEGRPYLGICLGYQLLFESSEESAETQGLATMKGHVKHFTPSPGLKIPHMGWNTARFTDPTHPVWKDLGEESAFYFVHSYYPEPEEKGQQGCVTDYNGNFFSGVVAPNLVAVQYHPEKSQNAGLTLLRNSVTFLQE